MRTIAFAILSVLGLTAAAAQAPSVYVDAEGVMRWSESNKEVALFGVNYSTPFAHAFRAHARRGISHEEAIDADVYHLARLGLDAYRIHVWDREITDPQGNLLVNEHMRAFDYLLAKLKERGIKIILTPLQFGNAAYPEDGVPLMGYSANYGKQGSLEDKTSWPLQERYLSQFVSHVNPHTGLAYKDDPDIIAFEINNEPGHFEYDLTIEYINRMARSIRDTGSEKPIFYNMSHGLPVFQAYLDAEVQGGTFQWYPANLVAGREQRGNFLPYVDDYPIPFADNPKFKSKAKMVYEFDAADIGRAYVYPAIARTYRKVGMQFATMFAYDPFYIAPFNSEYQTHYMNLAYAPQKALGLMIAGEAFRRVPLFEDYGDYPGNREFAGIRVSYTEDLAELAVKEKFYYSNDTDTPPPAPDQLAHVAGYGDSPVVRYPGRGAYFIDRLEAGVWRLEVMPDAVWVRDPYEKPNPEKHVSRIAWNVWPMEISLPDLGEGFSAVGLNDGNAFRGAAHGRTLSLRPGVYLLTRNGVSTDWSPEDRWRNITLGEFVAPPASFDKTYVLHSPIIEASTDEGLEITATVASNETVRAVELVAYLPDLQEPEQPNPSGAEARQQPGGGNTPGVGQRSAGGARSFPMQRKRGMNYAVTIPAEELVPGTLRYHLSVETADEIISFPSEIAAHPTDWSFYGEPWRARLVAEDAPVLLFEASEDFDDVTSDYRDVVYDLVPSDRPGSDAMEVRVSDLWDGEPDHSFRFFFKEKARARRDALRSADRLVLFGKSATDRPTKMQLALVTSEGIAYGAVLTLAPEHGEYSVSVEELRQVRSPNIPYGYPSFIPYWSSVNESIPLDLEEIESVLVSIGPDIPESEYEQVHGVHIERIWLE